MSSNVVGFGRYNRRCCLGYVQHTWRYIIIVREAYPSIGRGH